MPDIRKLLAVSIAVLFLTAGASAVEFELLITDDSNFFDIQNELELIAQATVRTAGGKPSSRRVKLMFKTDTGLTPGVLKTSGNASGWVAAFNPDSGRWKHDFNLRRQIYGCLLLRRFSAEHPASDPAFLPAWIAAAIWNEENILKTSAKFSSWSRYFPALRFLAAKGKFPDFSAIRNIPADNLSQAELRWLGELASAVLEAARQKTVKTDDPIKNYVLFCSQSGINEQEAFKAAFRSSLIETAESSNLPLLHGKENWRKYSESQKLQELFTAAAYSLAWNNYFTIPPEILRLRTEDFFKISLPVKDEYGQNTGAVMDTDMEHLPELLGKYRYPAELKELLESKFIRMVCYSDRVWTATAAKVKTTAWKLFETSDGNNDKNRVAVNDYKDALKKISEELESRERRMNFFDSVTDGIPESPATFFSVVTAEFSEYRTTENTMERSIFFNKATGD